MSLDDEFAALAAQQQLEEQQMTSIVEKLATIQAGLKAPKGRTNDFGGFNYRSCEDILMAVKPLLNGLTMMLSDEVVAVGERVYVKATVRLTDGSNTIVGTAYAREAIVKKGMDEAQITGSASSYARKYALAGLFLIDNEKDPDTRDNSDEKGKVHTPTNGAMDALTPKEQAKARKIAAAIVDQFNQGNEWGAFEEAQGIDDPEMKIAIWDVLKPHSTIRARLKEMAKEAEKPATV